MTSAPAAERPHANRSGRVVDIDAHVMLQADQLLALLGPNVYGHEAADWVRRFQADIDNGPSTRSGLDLSDDQLLESLASVRGWRAFGASDSAERADALERMGIDYQFVFHTGMTPALLSTHADAFDACRRYNAFIVDWCDKVGPRAGAVGLVNMSDQVKAARTALEAVDSGVAALQVPCAGPPAGYSPADGSWDEFWALLADHRVPAMLHLGSESIGNIATDCPSFLDRRWARTSNLRPSGGGTAPGLVGAFDLVGLHHGPQTFLTALVMGGVFARHPQLSVGVIEYGASWVNPWVTRMEAVVDEIEGEPFAWQLPRRPSAYVVEHVRVSAEPSEALDAVLATEVGRHTTCFSSDYPHLEGHPGTVTEIVEALSSTPPAVLDAYLSGNGSRLCRLE